jgi:hypothetical protein
MFLPDQTKNDFAELLGDEKTLRKLKKTKAATGSKQTPDFQGPSGGLGLDEGCCDDDGCGVSRSDRRAAQRNAAKAISGMKKGSDKRSWKQIMIGVVILVAMSGGLISTIWTIVSYLAGASLFPLVDVGTDEAVIQEIFFGGEPYVVYCQAGTSKAIPKFLVDSGNSLPRGINTVMVNCAQVMAGTDRETVWTRFHMDPKGMQAFVVANGERPIQFSREAFYNPEYFVEFVNIQSAPKFREIETSRAFASYCAEKERCIAIGHKGKLKEDTTTAIQEANAYFRKTKLVTVDTSKYAIKLDEVLSKSLEKQLAEGKTGKSYLSGLCYFQGQAFVRRITHSEIYYFIDDCLKNKGLEKLSSVPSLDVKPPKKKKKTKTTVKKASPAAKPAAPVEDETPDRSQYADDGMDVEDIDFDE